MKASFPQQAAHTPSPSTGSRQAMQSVGSAMSSASFAACRIPFRKWPKVPRKWLRAEREGAISPSMRSKLAPLR
jgi:hypothetical protein